MPLNLEPGATLRQYRITRLLGRGGMGEVYAADDTKLGRKVAIKILPVTLAHDAERLRRFTQEAKAASALNHPSILTIYDVDEVDGHPFLVTEFIDGQTLRERLREGGLTLRESLEIAGQIANALGTAHAAGIVHRDVKPENIMLREDGHAKLVDFGLAKIEQEGTTTSDAAETVAAVTPHTTPGLVMGTTQYMSPEQARGLKVDARSDIFSLGVVLYEMAAGRPPFGGDTPSDVIAAILHFDPPAIADAPPDLEHILLKALEKDRDERHQTAKDLAADLKRLRRRLDPSTEGSRSSTAQGSASWTSTPKSGGTPPSTSSGSAAATATPAIVAPAWTSTVVRFVWLSVAAFAAVTAIGVAGCLSLVGISWLQRDNDEDERPGAEDFAFDNMTIEKVSGLGQVLFPAISEDGKLLAYVATEGGQNAIWLRQMATGSVLKVTGPTPNAIADLQFTPDGNFLFYTESTTTRPIRQTLMAAPAFGGTAREVVAGRIGRAAFSPDGKQFATVRVNEAGNASELVIFNADGTGAGVPIATRPIGTYHSPSWSPSGRLLAVVVTERPKTGIQTNIQIMKPDGSDIRTVTPTGLSLIFAMTWATNDDGLIVTGTTGAISSPSQLMMVRASDGWTERITQDVNSYGFVSFSRSTGTIATVQRAELGSTWIGPAERPEEARELPSRLTENDGADGLSWLDNRQLLFTRRTDVPSVWIVNDDGTGARRLTEGSWSVTPTASRNGQVIAFASDRQSRGVPQVFSLTIPESRVTQITREGATHPRFSPDARTLFFNSFSIEGPTRLQKMSLDGGPVTTLLESPNIREFDISADGTLIAAVTYASAAAVRNVVIVPGAGGESRIVFTSGGAPRYVNWYPSGDALLLINEENRQSNLYRLDLASGSARRLTNFTRGSLSYPAISPDGRRIAYYRGNNESDIVLLKRGRRNRRRPTATRSRPRECSRAGGE